ncbi:MAG: glycosyltransferase family 39 protein [Burkholderiaceae bacterium]|nr:glycosyltransferase family 39 protein [Burkholderiaceae bacterium]
MTSYFERAFGDAERARRSFWIALLVLTALRAWFAAALPMTSDEAYFAQWGRYPAWGFYDHPPMIGWWLALLDRVSDSRFALRLPALLAPPLIAALGWALMRRRGEALAWSAATLLLLVPLNAWNVAITTDIPLMLFAALTVVLYLRALASGRSVDFLLTGFALSGALLSKYFAGLLAIALFLHSVSRPTPASLRGLLWIVAGSLPGAAIQIAWNAQNCWPNVMFNLINRHGDAALSWRTPLLYAASLAYVLTPAVAWRLLRGPREALRVTGADAARDRRALRFLALAPLAIFALLSLVKTIGLHWLASFVFPAVLWFALTASARSMARALAFASVFALLHWVAIGALAALPTEVFRAWSGYPGLVMTVHGDELAAALSPWRTTHVIAADGYSPAVTIGNALGEHVIVFGRGTSHARHDDILTDFRALDGKDILIVRRRDDRIGEFDAYFDRAVHETITVRGATFHLVDGRGFRYEVYRDRVLDEIRRRYYAVPRWLPGDACYFCDRYFPDRSCRAP